MGVFRAVESSAYEELNSQLAAETRAKVKCTLEQLFNSGDPGSSINSTQGESRWLLWL